jgi:hypothetical protein
MKEPTMQTEIACTTNQDSKDEATAMMHGPSADFIHAVSQFLDTDPKDLLVELGYYREDEAAFDGAR